MTADIGADWVAPFLESYRIELGEWLGSVDRGVALGPSAQDAYAGQAVVDAAAGSDDSGRSEPVALIEQPALYRRYAT